MLPRNLKSTQQFIVTARLKFVVKIFIHIYRFNNYVLKQKNHERKKIIIIKTTWCVKVFSTHNLENPQTKHQSMSLAEKSFRCSDVISCAVENIPDSKSPDSQLTAQQVAPQEVKSQLPNTHGGTKKLYERTKKKSLTATPARELYSQLQTHKVSQENLLNIKL